MEQLSRQVRRAMARAKPIKQAQPKIRRWPKPGHILHVERVGRWEHAYHATKGWRWRPA
jgi:EAL domain-containing protein (putative c-di-GMP-specific phosphodiesterase class I)